MLKMHVEWLKAAHDDLIQLLDTLYLESRYPNDMGLLPYGKPTLKDAKEFYEFAQKLFDDICQKLDIHLNELAAQII